MLDSENIDHVNPINREHVTSQPQPHASNHNNVDVASLQKIILNFIGTYIWFAGGIVAYW